MQFYIQNLQANVLLFLVLSSLLMVVGMRDKWHWFLLIPVVVCAFGVYLFYRPASYLPEVDIQYKEVVLKSLILLVSVVVVSLSVFLDPQTDTDTQLVIRGVALFLLSFLAACICFVTDTPSVPVKVLLALLVLFTVILAFGYVLLENKTVRGTVYMTFTAITTFFLLYYVIATITLFFRKTTRVKQQQATSMGGFTFRQLPDFNVEARRRVV